MVSEPEQASPSSEESFHTVIVGGGQAGLAAGYFLARQGVKFTILDGQARTGDAWRCRWESLRLFTPSQFDGLPGMPFPRPKNYFPTKDEVADYLEDYADQFHLPVRHNLKVESLSRDGTTYRVNAGPNRFSAGNVIVATGPYHRPFVPDFAGQLDRQVFQLHTSAYYNPQQIPVDSLLVVGAGNSGVEIALELARAGKRVWLAGRDVGRLPSNSPLGRVLDGRPMWWVITHLLTVDTPMGRKVQAASSHGGTPLGRASRRELVEAGIPLAPRVSGVQSGHPSLEDGQVLPVEGVIWATGYRPDYEWIHLPILDEHGYPRHTRGAAQGAPGLYFLGLHFQTGLSSPLLGGVGKDAGMIAQMIARNGG